MFECQENYRSLRYSSNNVINCSIYYIVMKSQSGARLVKARKELNVVKVWSKRPKKTDLGPY